MERTYAVLWRVNGDRLDVFGKVLSGTAVGSFVQWSFCPKLTSLNGHFNKLIKPHKAQNEKPKLSPIF
jgi:hypothetical protein